MQAAADRRVFDAMTRETFFALCSLLWLLSSLYLATLAVVWALHGRAYIPVP